MGEDKSRVVRRLPRNRREGVERGCYPAAMLLAEPRDLFSVQYMSEGTIARQLHLEPVQLSGVTELVGLDRENQFSRGRQHNESVAARSRFVHRGSTVDESRDLPGLSHRVARRNWQEFGDMRCVHERR